VETLTQYLAGVPIPGTSLSRYEEMTIHRRPEAAGVLRLAIRLYDPQLPAAWVSRLSPTSCWLVETAARGLGISEARISALQSELVGISDLLVGEAGPASPLRHQLTPLAAFHAIGWFGTGRREIYCLVAPIVHVRARRLEAGMAASADAFGARLLQNLSDYLRSARLLLEYNSPVIDPALAAECVEAVVHSAPGPARMRLIEAVLARWTAKHARSPQTVNKRRTQLQVLLGLEPHIIHLGSQRPGGPARRMGGSGSGRTNSASECRQLAGKPKGPPLC
jgi:hypothetical protein